MVEVVNSLVSHSTDNSLDEWSRDWALGGGDDCSDSAGYSVKLTWGHCFFNPPGFFRGIHLLLEFFVRIMNAFHHEQMEVALDDEDATKVLKIGCSCRRFFFHIVIIVSIV